MVGDMENLKVYVEDEVESEEVQKLLFDLNCYWYGEMDVDKNNIVEPSSPYPRYIHTNEFGRMYYCAEHNSGSLKTKQQLKDLVVLKRNSIDDASFKDAFGDIWYADSTNSYWMFENGVWREAEKPLFELEPIKKLVDKEVKMKEFLNPEQGYALVKCFVGETPIPESWIEVPEGAEILYFEKRHESANHFFKVVNGKSYYKYLEKDSEWIEYDIEGLDEFKDTIDNFRVVWQRNPTTTPNTSIQNKLKFIEKWLNGEKIQYILGVESDKTQSDKSQWHNFTEGAMQYIKRSDIKFREAPKCVTINGIEFKSVEKLLKHVKNNFDLEDGENLI